MSWCADFEFRGDAGNRAAKQQLEKWKEAVQEARDAFYYSNHKNVDECFEALKAKVRSSPGTANSTYATPVVL